MTFRNKKSGFTLIELLVVIAIIGILASVILGSLSTARSKARDARRREHLHSIQTAMELYFSEYGNYCVNTTAGPTGSGGGCQGWFGFEDGGYYPKAISRGLEEAGVLAASPVNVDDYAEGGFILTLCNGATEYAVSAYLENPKASETAHVNDICNSALHLQYNHNYAIP